MPEPEVHLWTIDLGAAAAAVDGVDLLSADERARAGRYASERDRRRFIRRRSLLRRILAGYLGCPADAVAFVYGAHGKPSLAPVVNSGDLRFSHSVTGDLALIGVAHAREIGVDVEREDPAVDLEQVRRRTLSPAENDDLDRLPAVDRRGRFFTIWTLKEAALKAIGTGLTVEPDQIEVRPARAGSPPDWTLASSHPAIDATRWRLRRVEVRAGHAAALAFEGAIAAEIVRRTIRDLT